MAETVERGNAVNRLGNGTGLVRRWLGAWLLGLTALGVGTGMLAPAAWTEDAAEPAARAARLSSVDGQVTILQGSQLITDQAVANAPLFEGMRVATGDDGRAEIQLEDGSVARLSPNSWLTLTVLRGQGGAGEAEIELGSGLGYFELQGGGEAGTIRIRFGYSVVTASGFTVLRINMDNAPGELAVFSGNAHLERGQALTADLHGGQSVALSATDPTHFDLSDSIEPDSWDSWNSDRDQVLTAEAASKTGAAQSYANSSNPAWNDLDANGTWYDVPGQGNIWSPFAASGAGWDPYGSGYWMWTPRFGYIWVSGYSWGYLPFQCGNWNYYDSFGWGWMPGTGGCSPWWGGGGYFVPNVGIGYGGYRPPMPPHLRPRPPIGRGGHNEPMPLVAVNRHPAVLGNALPTRDGKSPVVIAGQTVQAVRPLNPRPQFERPESSFVNRTPYSGSSPGANGGARTAGAPASAGWPSFGGSRTGGSGNAQNSSTGRPSGGGGPQGPPASHGSSSSGAASHGSSGGGGAASSGSSGGHSSSGGGSSGGGYSGGGGGGASHGGGGGASSGGGGSHK